METERKLMTAGQLGERLNVSKSYIYRAAHLGRIPYVRPFKGGKTLRFDTDQIEDWIKKNSFEVKE